MLDSCASRVAAWSASSGRRMFCPVGSSLAVRRIGRPTWPSIGGWQHAQDKHLGNDIYWPPLARKIHTLAAVLWRCWLAGRNGIRPVKIWVVGCWSGYLSGARFKLLRALVMSPGMLRRDISCRFIIIYYYLHTAQLMPLPLTVSCFRKIHLSSPGKRAINWVR